MPPSITALVTGATHGIGRATPSISPKSADAGPPKSWGLGYRLREHRTFQSMTDRIVENRAGRGPPL
jgi:hypothetical protein